MSEERDGAKVVGVDHICLRNDTTLRQRTNVCYSLDRHTLVPILDGNIVHNVISDSTTRSGLRDEKPRFHLCGMCKLMKISFPAIVTSLEPRGK